MPAISPVPEMPIAGFRKPNPTRFAPSENYLLLLARDHGFNVVYSQPVEKMTNDVNGILFWQEKAD